MSVAEAFVTVRPDTQRFGRDLRSSLGGLAKVGAAAGVAIGAAVVGAAADGIRQFAKFEQQMNEVFTLLPGISDQAMGQMQDDVRDFSVEMGVATDDVVPALYQAISAGVPEDNVFEFLEIATQASIGGITDLETAVDGITSVVNAYGEETISAQEASDILFTTVRLGKTDFEQLSSSVFQVAPIASAAGVAFEDVAAGIATLTGMGTPTSVAMTQMRSAITELTQEGTKASDAFSEISGKTFPEFMESGGNLEDALGFLAEAAKDSGGSVLDLFGSVEAGQAVLGLTGEGADSFSEALDEMADSAGATEEAFNQMDQGSSRAWERLGVAINDLRIGIGEQLAPTVERAVNWIVENMPAIEEAVGNAMDTAIEWMGRGGEAWGEFYTALQDNWPTIKSIFESLGEIVADIADIFGVEMARMTEDTGESTGSMAESVEGLATALDEFLNAVETVTGAVSASWETLTGILLGEFDLFTMGLDEITDGAYTRFKEATYDTAEEAGAALRAFIRAAIEWFRDLPGEIVEAIGDLSGLLKSAGRAVIGGFTDGLTERWESTREWLSTRAAEIRDLKGPIEYDRTILEGAGHAVIEGFGRGMSDEWRQIERQLGTFTAEIPTNMAGVDLAGGRSGVTINGDVHVGSSQDLGSLKHEVRKMAVEHA